MIADLILVFALLQQPDIWCTAEGYRVSPTGLGGEFDSSKLHRPVIERVRQYEIEYCRRIEREEAVVYFSAQLRRRGRMIKSADVIVVTRKRIIVVKEAR